MTNTTQAEHLDERWRRRPFWERQLDRVLADESEK